MGISQGGQGRGSLFTEINITPLTDIFLVLLIIMMVIAPMFDNTNKSIKVPKIHSGQSMDHNPLTVEITKDGQYFVAGTVTQPSDLKSQLQTQFQKTKDENLVVRADKSTHSSEVIKVYEAASVAGFKKLTIAGEPLSASRQNQLMNQENSGKVTTPPSEESSQ